MILVCLSTHLSHTTESTLSRIKCERYIFIKKCVRSFIEVRHYLWLYFRLYLYVGIQLSLASWIAETYFKQAEASEYSQQ